MWTKLLILLFGIHFTKGTEKRDYSDYHVVRFYVENTEQLEAIEGFLETHPQIIQFVSENYDSEKQNNEVDLVVNPYFVKNTLEFAAKIQMQSEILESNLQFAMETENVPIDGEKFEFPNEQDLKATSCFGAFDFKKYHRFGTIINFMDCIAHEYPNLVTIQEIGKSTEGRPIRVMKISKPGVKAGRPSIFIEGGIHAREWISPASVLFIMYEFVVHNNRYQEIFDNYNVYILPVLNPDGYEYTHTNDRMWRKTRSKQGRCYGVDPNRNFGYKWGGKGTSNNPCSDVYKGPFPFSEPELASLRDFVMPQKNQFVLYLAFHSYGQYILYPWGYDRIDAQNVKELHKLGNYGANAARRYGHRYNVGNSAKLLYPAAGASDDWAMGGAGIRYSYTIELPDKGTHGFILPTYYIHTVAPGALEMTKAMILHLHE